MSQALFRKNLVEGLPPAANDPAGVSWRPLHQPLRILLVCSLYMMPYRIMRTAQATGADVYVLGNEASKGFRFSRFCKQFTQSSVAFDGSVTDEILDEINRYVAEYEIDIVMAGDAPSTRSVIGLKDRIAAHCFPTPSLQQFDQLNNKWYFTNTICRELNILTPSSRLFETKDDLLRAFDAGEISLPSIAKPLALEGNHGVLKLEAPEARTTIEGITYSPILVQTFIKGEDIGASVYCEGGEIRNFILHRLKRAVYSTFDNDSVREALSKIMQKMGVDGVYNFDMRLADDGRIYYLECNPRFFFKTNLSMAAGINFVQAGLPVGNPPPATVPDKTLVRMPKAFTITLPTPWRLSRRDFGMLAYLYADPIPYFREILRIEYEP